MLGHWNFAKLLGPIVVLVTAVASEAEITVTPDQHVTINGDYASLEALVEDLAWRANFELRSFGLDDRSVVTKMDRVTLEEALRRLVGRDLFTMGLNLSTDGTARVTWVEIPGPRESIGARRGRAKPRASGEAPFKVPPKLFLTAFESADPNERAGAFRAISERVLTNPEERQRFLATDVAMFVHALAKYPDAAETLGEIARAQTDVALRAKLDQVITAIEAASTPDSGSPP